MLAADFVSLEVLGGTRVIVLPLLLIFPLYSEESCWEIRLGVERVIEPRIPFPPARIAVSDGGAAVRRKGCGIRGAASRICGLSAEGGSKVLVFDLHALKKASGRVSARHSSLIPRPRISDP